MSLKTVIRAWGDYKGGVKIDGGYNLSHDNICLENLTLNSLKDIHQCISEFLSTVENMKGGKDE